MARLSICLVATFILAALASHSYADGEIATGVYTGKMWDGTLIELAITSVDASGAPHGTISYTHANGGFEGPYSFNASLKNGSIQRGDAQRMGDNFLNMHPCGDAICTHHIHHVISVHGANERTYSDDLKLKRQN